MRWFYVFGLSVQLFSMSFEEMTPSSSEEILSLTSNLLIDNYVSAASGQIVLSEIDLHVKGAQDLVLKRTYIPPQILGRYGTKEEEDKLYLIKALSQLKVKGWIMHPHLWAGFNRNSPYFQLRDPQGFVLAFEMHGNQGILKNTNFGCSNLRADEPSSRNDIRNIALYKEGNLVRVVWPDGIQRHYLHFHAGIFRLEKEVLPNGKTIRYEYNLQGLFKISSCDPTGQFTYASITLDGKDRYVSSDGKAVSYLREIRGIQGKIKHKKKYEESIDSGFTIMTKASNPSYVHTIGYNERTLLTSYDAKAYPISCSYFQFQDVPTRIKTFSTPSGSTSFLYNPPIADQKNGTTTVIHPDGLRTIYRFNKRLLLESIENCREKQSSKNHKPKIQIPEEAYLHTQWDSPHLGLLTLVNKKTFTYDDKQHIKSIETRDGEGNLLVAKRFECDVFGNPCLERTEADCGVFSIRRTFDKNRLVFEDRDDGLQYMYTYLGDTWLVTSKTTLGFGGQLRKTVYVYDNANNLIEELEESKTKTRYILYQTAPHLHRVEWEEKWDWDNQLIHKIHYIYDKWGNTEEEQFIDATWHNAYTIRRTYNEKGELLSETNPLNQTAHYKYDERGRCFYEEPVSNEMVIRRTFDDKGRLQILRENDHETKFEYNSADKVIVHTDYLGYTTKYYYDPVHEKSEHIEEAGIVTKIVYDAFGRERERFDGNGARTQKHYNSYGELTKILYPEGGEHSYVYAPNGLLKSHTDPDGLQTKYERDVLGRVTEQTVGGYTTSFHYDGYNLYTTIDALGMVTEYKHDYLNRKIEEKRQNRLIYYGYDALGYLAWEKRGDRRTDYIHDVLGRLRKKVVDNVLEKSWTYDRGGNIASIEHGGLTTFSHDAYNRLIETIDPEGHKTTIHYTKNGQQLLKTITDPMGISTLETYNAKGQLLRQEVAGQLVREFTYDNLFRVRSQDHLTFGYSQNGNKEWMKEADRRATKWTYSFGNRTSSQQKHDGSTLLYKYDDGMRLVKVGEREFRYDALDRLIGGTGFLRQLDAFGNITREEWVNGLWIETDYDDWDRPLERRLPDLSRIRYEYEGPFLKNVKRVSVDGEEQYSHSYARRDAKGNVLLENGLFETTYKYDKLGRKKVQSNPYFMEVLDYSANGNLVQQGNCTYTYDDLFQMTSQSDRFSAKYDAHYNLREINGQTVTVDSLNQIAGVSYDLNGNLLKPGFVYDEFGQLAKVGEEEFTYDALGRRIQRGTALFLYIGDEEIGSFEKGHCKELKIPGIQPIAIEIEGKPYAPIHDAQGTIRLLVDRETKEVVKTNDCDVFGVGLTNDIPYAYAGKRYDPKLGLVYFGQRYYDPAFKRWLTPDPIGPEDHSNLYQYVFNNPYRYRDLNGEFAFAIPLLFWGAELAIPAISSCITYIAYGAAVGAIAYGGCKAIELISKNADVYVPDRPLPNTPDGIPIPDVDVPHTQLGTRGSKKRPGEQYPQAREFGKDGKPVKGIDFTDHGRPWNHPNPHEHPYEPNPTGGTPGRGNGKPLENWVY